MSPMNGTWELRSFEVEADGKVKEPFGKDPIGLLVFAGPPGDDSYMGAQLTTGPGGAGPPLTFSFSATFEVKDSTYRFTTLATNAPGDFHIGVATGWKAFQILADGKIFEESWREDDGTKKTAIWRRLHDA